MTSHSVFQMPDVVIKVHPCDTLVFSFPIWLICHGSGVPVRLQPEPISRVDVHRVMRHEQPRCQVGGIEVTHLMSVLEAVHEMWPYGGVWPIDQRHRALTRDTCAGIVALCAGATPFLLSLPTSSACVDPDLSERVRSMMLDTCNYGNGSPCSVTALTVLAPLLGISGLLDRSSLRLVQILLAGESTRAWFANPSVRQRLSYYPKANFP